MRRNLGSADRIVRILVGLALLSLLWVGSGNQRWFGLIGLVPLLTAVIGTCPLYALLGITTHRTGRADDGCTGSVGSSKSIRNRARSARTNALARTRR